MTVARRDGYEYVWMDTCCIDKTSSTEVSEALNSMFKWYEQAAVCYVYLDDVDDQWAMNDAPPANIPSVRIVHTSTRPVLPSEQKWVNFTRSEWFTRGWTLQELLAPRALHFYNSSWKLIRTRDQIADVIAWASGVDSALLHGNRSLKDYSIAQRLSWAANRCTTRIEDRTYSLFGVLDIRIPVLYGEGEAAFDRLQEQILLSTTDTTIFAWQTTKWPRALPRLLARSLDDFKESGRYSMLSSTMLQQQRFQVLGSRQVRFDAYLFKPWNDTVEEQSEHLESNEIVVACVDGARDVLVTLPLVRRVGTNSAYVVREIPGGRLHRRDLYTAQDMNLTSVVDVWRTQRFTAPFHWNDSGVIVLLRTSRRKDDRLNIIRAGPDSYWSPDRRAFCWPQGQNRTDWKGFVTLGYADKSVNLLISRQNQRIQIRFEPIKDRDFRYLQRTWRYQRMKESRDWTTGGRLHFMGYNHLRATLTEVQFLQHRVQCINLGMISHSELAMAVWSQVTSFCQRKLATGIAFAPVVLSLLPLFLIYIAQSSQTSEDSAILGTADAGSLGTLIIGALIWFAVYLDSVYGLCFMTSDQAWIPVAAMLVNQLYRLYLHSGEYYIRISDLICCIIGITYIVLSISHRGFPGLPTETVVLAMLWVDYDTRLSALFG